MEFHEVLAAGFRGVLIGIVGTVVAVGLMIFISLEQGRVKNVPPAKYPPPPRPPKQEN